MVADIFTHFCDCFSFRNLEQIKLKAIQIFTFHIFMSIFISYISLIIVFSFRNFTFRIEQFLFFLRLSVTILNSFLFATFFSVSSQTLNFDLNPNQTLPDQCVLLFHILIKQIVCFINTNHLIHLQKLRRNSMMMIFLKISALPDLTVFSSSTFSLTRLFASSNTTTNFNHLIHLRNLRRFSMMMMILLKSSTAKIFL